MTGRAIAALVVLALAVPRAARADETRTARADETRTARADETRDDGAWGWWLLGGSIVVGGAVTALGLTVDCGANDTACNARASLGIYGGAGIAAIGSFVGLIVVSKAERAAKAQAAAKPEVRVSIGASGAAIVGTF